MERSSVRRDMGSSQPRLAPTMRPVRPRSLEHRRSPNKPSTNWRATRPTLSRISQLRFRDSLKRPWCSRTWPRRTMRRRSHHSVYPVSSRAFWPTATRELPRASCSSQGGSQPAHWTADDTDGIDRCGGTRRAQVEAAHGHVGIGARRRSEQKTRSKSLRRGWN